jgi:GST-like protein
MIRFYFHPTPNSAKVALLLEETGLEYEIEPVDTIAGEQHAAQFLAVNPNGKVPAIIDLDGPGGKPCRVFDSSAILLYLGDKTDEFIGTARDRPELLSWLFFLSSGLGPFSGQAVHFKRSAPQKLPYAINRYEREIKRHYQVLDTHLQGRRYILDNTYTIADMSAWGWVGRAALVFPDTDEPLAAFPNVQRWFAEVDGRPAAERARAVGKDHTFKTELDEAALRALFPQNYPEAQALEDS